MTICIWCVFLLFRLPSINKTAHSPPATTEVWNKWSFITEFRICPHGLSKFTRIFLFFATQIINCFPSEIWGFHGYEDSESVLWHWNLVDGYLRFKQIWCLHFQDFSTEYGSRIFFRTVVHRIITKKATHSLVFRDLKRWCNALSWRISLVPDEWSWCGDLLSNFKWVPCDTGMVSRIGRCVKRATKWMLPGVPKHDSWTPGIVSQSLEKIWDLRN